MITLRRIAYLLIAASIGFALLSGLRVWFEIPLLLGLFGARLYLLTLDPVLSGNRRLMAASIGIWALLHYVVGVSAAAVRDFVGLPLLSLPLIYWLMTRFSTVTETWITLSFRVTTVLLALAGFGALMVNEVPAFSTIIPICLFIIAAHFYHTFTSPNGNRTLAAHWVVLTLLLWLGAFIGTALVPQLGLTNPTHAFGTVRLHSVNEFAALTVILGLGNQITADFRSENRRITGLSAYWLVAFGITVSTLITLLASAVHSYVVNRGLNPNVMPEDFYLISKQAYIWQWAIWLGLIIYLVQFWIRRPRFEPHPPPPSPSGEEETSSRL